MATPHEKLAEALGVLGKRQAGGQRVFQSKDLLPVHRKRLLQSGYLQGAMKGWLISSSPHTHAGDSTPWYASFREFCARYCQSRFGQHWHLSPEQSLLLHAENTVIPLQVVVYSTRGMNNTVNLLFGTSIYDLKQAQMPPAQSLTVREGLRLYSPGAALVKVPESFFNRHPIEAQVALASVRDASEVLRHLLDGGHSVVAGRLAGAFRRMGRPEIADNITATLTAAGYAVRETDPFAAQQTFAALRSANAPMVGRLQAMWAAMREPVIAAFPPPPGLPRADSDRYLKRVGEIYQRDAYHSLSIEGYRVTPELIDRVRDGSWDPDRQAGDRESRDALAARGYWQAFQAVKEALAKIIAGANSGGLLRVAHHDWYRELFQPCVTANLLPSGALAGYRNDAVYLRTSRYVPPRWEVVRDAMPALFDLLEQETEPAVRAVLGHWLLGYIHPYPDGNGRMARFLMNAMLASGGYPWTVIRVEDRSLYLSALDRASIDLDIKPFAGFVAERVGWAMGQNGPNKPEAPRR
jgi:hypothetical protein